MFIFVLFYRQMYTNTMKELVLHTDICATNQELTPRLVCAMLARLICGQQDAVTPIAPTEMPGRLLFEPEEDLLEAWFEDPTPHPDSRFSRYRCISFRPFASDTAPAYDVATDTAPASPSACSGWKIAVALQPPILIYTAAPLAKLYDWDTLPRLVVADGKVLPYQSLSLRQMARLEHVYAVVDTEMARLLHCRIRTEAGAHRNHYAALQKELDEMLASCFPHGQRTSDDMPHLSFTLSDVPHTRLCCIPAEHRRLLFNDSSEGDNPLQDFPRYGAFMIPAYRHTRLVMLYPQGEREAAQRFFDTLASFRSLIGLNLIKNEKNWVEYRMEEDPLNDIYQALYLLKTKHDSAFDLLLCYLSPSGAHAPKARRMYLAANIRRLCRFHQFCLLPRVPLCAIGHPAIGKRVACMASRLLADRGCFSWMPRNFATLDTDLIIGLSFLHPRAGMSSLCSATFYFNPKNYYGCRKVLKESLFIAYFSSLLKDSVGRFCSDHNGCLPQRIVVYCYRGLEAKLLKPLGDLLLRFQTEIPLILASVQLTAGDHPLFYDPRSACRMPADGTCISLGDDRYHLFCNDYRPDTHQEPSRYPFPLEIGLKRLLPGGELCSVEAEEARQLLVQAYQLTCVTPGRLSRSILPVVVTDADCLARRQHAENEAIAASRIDNAAGDDNVAKCQKPSPRDPRP